MLDKTQALLSPGTSVRIRKHRRQVGSEFATYLDFFWREDEPWLVLRLPSGHRTAVPVSWTDLPVDCFTQSISRAEILPAALLGLAQYCLGLRRGRGKRPQMKTRGRNKN
jgi:hypothetical protein